MFDIVSVDPANAILLEQLGTKRKFWYADRSWLFKEGRPGTGENWAEVVASHLCTALGLPHASYEFAEAIDDGVVRSGVVSPNFVPPDSRLVFGNEIMAGASRDYDANRRHKHKQYSLGRVRAGLRSVAPPIGFLPTTPAVTTSLDVFVGYLMLDAWIANQDRHHENWGLIHTPGVTSEFHLAPTFDHAAGFARSLTDQQRQARLSTNDSGFDVTAFAAKALSPFYQPNGDDRLLTIDAFRELAQHRPEAKAFWLRALAPLDESRVRPIFDDVPAHLISTSARDFAIALLECNRNRLLQC